MDFKDGNHNCSVCERDISHNKLIRLGKVTDGGLPAGLFVNEPHEVLHLPSGRIEHSGYVIER